MMPLESRANTHTSVTASTATTIPGRGARTSSSQAASTAAVSEIETDSDSMITSHWTIATLSEKASTVAKATYR
jgi:hypothetical protein